MTKKNKCWLLFTIKNSQTILHAETCYYKVLNKKAFINALWIYEHVSHNAGRRAIQEAFEYNYYRCSDRHIIEKPWYVKYWWMHS